MRVAIGAEQPAEVGVFSGFACENTVPVKLESFLDSFQNFFVAVPRTHEPTAGIIRSVFAWVNMPEREFDWPFNMAYLRHWVVHINLRRL